MASETICCPYCNSQVTVSEQAPPARVTCPRCGEAFPYRPVNGTAAAAEPGGWGRAPAEHSVGDPAAAGLDGRRRLNRSLALGIVGAMLAVAAGALGFALMTKPVRR